MNKYRKILATMAAFVAVTLGAVASPVYYTIFHALDEETMEVFKDGGHGSLSVSTDGGETYKGISNFRFDRYGRGLARVYPLNRVSPEAMVKLEAAFNESDKGQPLETVVESTVGEFLDSLMPYKKWSWLTYAPVYVSYESLPDIVDTAVAAGSFNILVQAVQTAGLEDALRSEGPFTVFAPTDEAFTNLLVALELSPEELLADEGLADVLLYHVVSGALDGSAVAAETHIETLLGKDVDVTFDGTNLFINSSQVVLGNIEASNGIIHVIDAVLLPPTLPTIPEVADEAGIFTTLVAALQETGLDAALTNEGPFTVFAPTDAAFSNLLSALDITAEQLLADPDLPNVLLYHVVDGRLKAEDVVAVERLKTLLGNNVKVNVTDDGVFINDSKIIVTDIKAENGIIHVIDAVLVPEEMPNIVEIADGAGRFETLVGALQATGLDEVLAGEGPYTVFAPTDEAFEKLPGWLLHFLVNHPKYLEQILLYHVVPGDLDAAEVIDAGSLQTANGRSVKARVKGESVYINRAKVIEANIEAANGTIHVIDHVLIPWFNY